jgi:hypothetical protein
MATPSMERVRGWPGRVVIDRDGSRIGEVTDRSMAAVRHSMG